MDDKSRIFGNNIKHYLKKNGITLNQIANELGYSEYEFQKIIDARLFLDRQEQKHITEVLGIPLDWLYKTLEDKAYENAGCLECQGEFSTIEHKKEILDIFDTYCDIQETLVDEGLK